MEVYALETMTASLVDLDLPEGWTCSIELQRSPEGSYDGRAELRRAHVRLCVLVVTQQATREAALEILQIQADDFIAEWNLRSA